MLSLCSILIGLSAIQDAWAQETPDGYDDGVRVIVEPGYPEQSTVVVDQIVRGVSVGLPSFPIGNNSAYNSSYSLWKVEPADAARILEPMPITPASTGIDIEFLQAATVTVTVRGYDGRQGAEDAGNEPGFNEVVYTFNVREDSDADTSHAAGTSDTPDPDSGPAALNKNQQQTQTAATRSCESIAAIPPEDRQSGQVRLLDTCDTLALLNDPAAALDRVAAEELFAIGDALTITADSQISNVQSRINTLRAGQNPQIDVGSLNIRLWDQTINGSILSSGKNALPGFSGGGASQDTVIDSALGFFVNGNLAVGKIDGKGVQRDASLSSNDLTIGADYRLDRNRVVGAALGIINDETDFTGDNGVMDMQGLSLSAFATWYEQDMGYADIIFDVSQNAFDLTRRLNLPGQASEFATSSTDATRMAMSVNVGRTFQRGATEFGPVARVAFTRAAIDGFSETASLAGSGSGAELSVKSHSLTSVRFSVGGEVKHVINTSKAVFVPAVRMELDVENETDKGAIAAVFVNDPDGNKMTISGTERDRTAVLLSIGSTAVFRHGQSAFAFFETRAQDEHVSQNRVRIGYRMHF